MLKGLAGVFVVVALAKGLVCKFVVVDCILGYMLLVLRAWKGLEFVGGLVAKGLVELLVLKGFDELLVVVWKGLVLGGFSVGF